MSTFPVRPTASAEPSGEKATTFSPAPVRGGCPWAVRAPLAPMVQTFTLPTVPVESPDEPVTRTCGLVGEKATPKTARSPVLPVVQLEQVPDGPWSYSVQLA